LRFSTIPALAHLNWAKPLAITSGLIVGLALEMLTPKSPLTVLGHWKIAEGHFSKEAPLLPLWTS